MWIGNRNSFTPPKIWDFPQDLDICTSALNKIIDVHVPTKTTGDTATYSSERKRKRRKQNTKEIRMVTTDCYVYPTVKYFDLWLSMNGMKRIPHNTFQYGSCLYESVAHSIPLWVGKPVEVRFSTIEWAALQVTEGTSWGVNM